MPSASGCPKRRSEGPWLAADAELRQALGAARGIGLLGLGAGVEEEPWGEGGQLGVFFFFLNYVVSNNVFFPN